MVIGRASSTWRSSDGMVGMLRLGRWGRKQNAKGRGQVRHAPRSSTISGRYGSAAQSAGALLRCLPGAALLGGFLGATFLRGALLGPALPGHALLGRRTPSARLLGGGPGSALLRG